MPYILLETLEVPCITHHILKNCFYYICVNFLGINACFVLCTLEWTVFFSRHSCVANIKEVFPCRVDNINPIAQ